MPNIKVTGLVTRFADYRESDRILNILTTERGIITVDARGCRRTKSPLLAGSQLFVSGEFSLFYNKERYTLNECAVTDSFFPLREDISCFSAASYMMSLVNAGITEGQTAVSVSRLLMYALTYTAYSDCQPKDMAICFAARFLNRLGYCPSVTFCAVCGAELLREKHIGFRAELGGALCHACMGENDMVSTLSLEALRRMLLLDDIDINRVKLPEQVQNELLSLINSYAEHVLGKTFKAILTI